MLVIFTQIPTLICIIFMGIQATRLLRADVFRLINIGWLFNIIYLLAIVFLQKLKFNDNVVNSISTVADVCNLYFFYLAIEKSKKIKSVSFDYLNNYVFLGILIVTGALSLFKFNEEAAINPFKVPFAVANSFVIFLLARFFKTFKEKHKWSTPLFCATTFYAVIQFLIVFSNRVTLSVFTLNEIGFMGGLVAKVSILLCLSMLILDSVKDITAVEQEYLHQSNFTSKLNRILGQTFHEIMPPIDETKVIINELTGKNSSRFTTSKGLQNIQVLENSLERIKAIVSASYAMYSNDVMNIKKDDDNLILIPVDLDEEREIFNLNAAIHIAVMNFKNNYLKKDEKNSYVSNRTITIEAGAHCNIKGSSAEIIQCIYNLLKNSFEAITEKNPNAAFEIFIKTKNLSFEKVMAENELGEKEPNDILETQPMPRKKYIRMEIEDDGPGIPADIADRIFDEGFSTKKVSGRGRGFGLNIVKNLVEENNGTISMESPVVNHHSANTTNPGTKFIFLFERVETNRHSYDRNNK